MYATVGDVKEFLGISKTGDDGLIADCLEQAQAYIDMKTGRTFEASADTTRYFDSIGTHLAGPVMYVGKDLCAITTITNGDGVEVTSGQYTTWPRNETPYYAIELLPSSTVTWRGQDDGDWQNAISIAGRWAYSTTAPDDIKHACKELAAFIYRQKDSPTVGVTIISEGGATATPNAFPPRVGQVIRAYSRVTW